MTAREPWRRVFPSWAEAEVYLKERGFSVGRMQGSARRGIMLGRCDIQKWRNLSLDDKEALHGLMRGGAQFGGEVTVAIFADAPAEAHEAVRRDVAVAV